MTYKALVTCGLVALGLASEASAQNHIYITGSTAFRARIFNSIINLPGWSPAITGPQAAFGGSHALGDNAQFMLFHGTYRHNHQLLLERFGNRCCLSGRARGQSCLLPAGQCYGNQYEPAFQQSNQPHGSGPRPMHG